MQPTSFKIFLFLLFLTVFFPKNSFSQIKKEAATPTNWQPQIRFTTNKGITIKGKVLSKKNDLILVESKEHGTIYFDIKQLRSIKLYDASGIPIEVKTLHKSFTTSAKLKAIVPPQPPVELKGRPIVKLETRRSIKITGKLLSKKGDSILVESTEHGTLFLSLTRLKTIQYFDTEGRELDGNTLNDPEINNSTTPTVTINIREGGSLKGKLLSKQNDSVQIELSKSQTLTLAIADIQSISRDTPRMTPQYKGSYYNNAPFKNHFAARGVLTPNGMPLLEGESYYQNVYGIIFHNFGFRVNDNINIAFGTFTIPLLGYLNPNVNFPIAENVHIGAGAAFWYQLGDVPDITPQIFGTLALGSRDNNIGVRLGYTTTQSNDFFEKGFAYSISGQVRASNNWSFVGELLALSPTEDVNILAIGARYLRPHSAIDFGFSGFGRLAASRFCPSCGTDFWFGMPYVTFTYLMGKK